MINIKELINDTSLLNANTLPELRDMVQRYPFFQLARLLYVRNLYITHSPQFNAELTAASAFVPDRTALFLLTADTTYELQSENSADENNSNKSRTMSLISTYIADGGIELENTSAQSKEGPSLADLTNDYASYLMKCDTDDNTTSDDVPHLKGEDLINSFISETQGKQRINMAETNEDSFTSPELSEEEEEIYTESMVNIYIKQGRYQQALEILRKICLNNPKKNSTFASQINLLEIITNSKKE